MKRILLLSMALCVMLGLFAAPPTGYYDSADHASGNTLRLDLEAIVGPHTEISYDNLLYLYKYSDTKDNAGSLILDIYSNCTPAYTTSCCASNSCNDGYNREHSVPKSWFNRAHPMYDDAFHLYPTSCTENSLRSNNPYGENNGSYRHTWAVSTSGASTTPGYSGTVFEPADEYKGDLARTYFYMATAYADKCSNWGGGMFGSDNNGFETWAINLLLQWNRQDPVSDKERKRNEAIYGNTTINKSGFSQGNRNPFIDYPCLAEFIWGTNKGTDVDFATMASSYDDGFDAASDRSGCGCVSTDPTLTTPQDQTSIRIGSTNLNASIQKSILVQGNNLTSDLTLSLSTTPYFTLSATSISANDAMGGVQVIINYLPTVTGTHSTTLTIASAEFDTVSVTLQGECLEEIIEPSSNSYKLVAQGFGDTKTITLPVKATNITSEVTLSLSGTDAAMYSLSTTSISQANALAGTNVDLTFTPTKADISPVTLTLNSGTATKTVRLEGQCTFAALPASHLTNSSFQANWTNIGAQHYTLDVFKKAFSGSTTQSTLFTETMASDPTGWTIDNVDLGGAPSVWNFDSQYTCMKASGYVNNGTHATESWFISPKIDLMNTANATLVFDHASYSGQSNADQLKVKVSTDGQTWTNLTIPTWPNARWEYVTASISLNSYVDQQIYIAFVYTSTLAESDTWELQNIKVNAGLKNEENVSISGYPQTLGQVTNHIVANLDTLTNYYYTVTPENGTISEEIEVQLSNTPTGTTLVNHDDFVYYIQNHVVYLNNLKPGSTLKVYSTTGQLLLNRSALEGSTQVTLERGAYVFQITGRSPQTFKVVL